MSDGTVHARLLDLGHFMHRLLMWLSDLTFPKHPLRMAGFTL